MVAMLGTLLVTGGGGGDDDKQIDKVTPIPTSDDGPSILAKGVVRVGRMLEKSALEITAEVDDGEVTGTIVFTDSDNDDSEVLVTVACADTDTDGLVILAGKITPTIDFPGTKTALGSAQQFFDPQIVLFIREGDPDSIAIFTDEGRDTSCSESLSRAQEVLDIDSTFVEVDGDIETG